MVFIQGAGLTRAQIERSRSDARRVGWWQVALRALFAGNRSA